MNLNELVVPEVPEVFVMKIAGENVEVGMEDSIKDVLTRELSARNITSFSIIIDGAEVTDSRDIPDTFGDVNTVEVQRYAKAGLLR